MNQDRELDHLVPATRVRAVEACRMFHEVTGHRLTIYFTRRTCSDQAFLFRSGRSSEDILSKQQSLRDRGYDYLAEFITQAGPNNSSEWKTNAAPGESWHNYGEAFDAVPLVSGMIDWDNAELWEIYGECVILLGMTWGGKWKNVDSPHAQRPIQGSALTGSSPEIARERLIEAGSLI